MGALLAYAICTIHRPGDKGTEVILASTREKPSVFETSESEFKDLEALGAARKATTGEIAEAGAVLAASGQADKPEEAPVPESVLDPAPPSGATGDPNGKPKGSKVKSGESLLG